MTIALRPSDGELVDAIAGGDGSALGTIWARYQSELQAHIRRLLGPSAPVEEIAQDVFLRFWTTAGRYDARKGPLRAYLHLIAKGKALDWIRSEMARRQREGNYRPTAAGDRTEAVEMRSAVESLPLKEHRAIWLAYYMGFTYRQVATILGIPEGTAKAQLGSALRRLHCLVADDPEPARSP